MRFVSTAAALLVFLSACGDDTTIITADSGIGDTGPMDAPIIFSMDGGPDLDATGAQDAPVAEDVPALPDASPDASDAGPSNCAFSFEGGLSECGVACNFDTRIAVGDCTSDYECFREAWVNDTTPMMSVMQPDLVAAYFDNFPLLITGQPGDSFCFRCTYYAALFCWNAACPDETTALLECLATTPGSACRPIADSVAQCAGMDPDFNACYGEQTNACYQF